MCERCEEEERRDEILKSFEKQKNQNRSCPIPKVEKSEEDEFFKKWYADISKMSRQLRECVLSSSSYLERMSKLYTQLQHLDLKNDKNEICGILKELKDYAIMATTTDGVAVKTADIILSMIVGQH